MEMFLETDMVDFRGG